MVVEKKPLVSVIVPTRNSEEHLEECLESVRGQTYGRIELIVVDNNSCDRTVEIASRYADVLLSRGPERCAQVNYGVKKASGKYVFYTGSDLKCDPDLVEQAVRRCEYEPCDAVYSNVLTELEEANIWQRARALERLTIPKREKLAMVLLLNRCGLPTTDTNREARMMPTLTSPSVSLNRKRKKERCGRDSHTTGHDVAFGCLWQETNIWR